MENFGGEIGQKMRSAVKAKLIELGTGSAGYIDDELPDYVMIMVANKRSKKQMITDLNLFLGEQTELFVTWLHEVLQKLQEVTLPTIGTVSGKKRKGHSSKDTQVKKEKKGIKRDKRINKNLDEVTQLSSPDLERPTTTSEESILPLPPRGSITDVFAVEFIEKAKQTLDVKTISKQETKEIGNNTGAQLSILESREKTKTTNEFDIPTISEISSTTENLELSKVEAYSSREKDLAELEEIQKKIYHAKKNLKAQGHLLIDEDDLVDNESLDKDYLNIKDDAYAEFFDENADKIVERSCKVRTATKSPIFFEISNHKNNKNKELHVLTNNKSKHVEGVKLKTFKETELKPKRNQKREHDVDSQSNENKKRSVHERLGLKQKSERIRQDKELYVPAHRRNELISSNLEAEKLRGGTKNSVGSKGQVRSRDQDHNGKGNGNVSSKKSENFSPDRSSCVTDQIHTPTSRRRTMTPEFVKDVSQISETRKRVGSRVIVAPTKLIEPSDDEDLNGKPVNSVIKIKPRQQVSPSKQACKNLLLRAVADAQRSTILAKKPKEKKSSSLRLGAIVSAKDRTTKLYTKSFRNRFKQDKDQLRSLRNKSENKEYALSLIPKSPQGHKKSDKCCDQTDKKEESDYEYVEKDKLEKADNIYDTQFVVTLNDKSRSKYPKRVLISRSASSSSLEQVTSSSMGTQSKGKGISTVCDLEKQKYNSMTYNSKNNLKNKSGRCESPSSSHHSDTPPIQISVRSELIEVYRKPKDINKIIIKADTDEDDELSPKVNKRTNSSKGLASEKGLNRIFQEETKQEIHKENKIVEGSLTPPLPSKSRIKSVSSPEVSKVSCSSQKQQHSSNRNSSFTQKRKHVPIQYDLDTSMKNSVKDTSNKELTKKARCLNINEHNSTSNGENDYLNTEAYETHRKINTRIIEDRKYDNIPSLSAVPVDTSALKVFKQKERCIYHPNCTKNVCEYYHPTAPCKAFPNCKYGDKCMYTHPKCKYDIGCVNVECNFMHSGQRNITTAAPPLSSHVVPVQTYKSISANTASNTSVVMCKYYPNCTKIGCPFYHPKPCRFGKNCINKLECNFYHHEVQSCNKFKWVAQTG